MKVNKKSLESKLKSIERKLKPIESKLKSIGTTKLKSIESKLKSIKIYSVRDTYINFPIKKEPRIVEGGPDTNQDPIYIYINTYNYIP